MNELPSHRLKQAKRALRRQVLAARDAMPPGEREAKSATIAATLLGLPELAGRGPVMTFWSFGSEVATAPLIDRLHAVGRTVALPRVEGEVAVPVVYAPGAEVRVTSYGAREPVGGRALDPAELEVVLVPGVAFDASGARVGYGGGFYDRLLSRLRPPAHAIAIAFSLQVVPEVPAGRTDRRVEAIVTEREVIRCR